MNEKIWGAFDATCLLEYFRVNGTLFTVLRNGEYIY